MPPYAPILERFWTKVDKRGPDDCWRWTAGLTRNGYGAFHGIQGKTAHRMAYTVAFGAPAFGLHVLHKCDNRKCVNPAHLFLGTQTDNMTDMVAKQRQARGGAHSQAKLTEAQVRDMRALATAGVSHRDLAASFSVGRSYVSAVVTRARWSHLV